MSFDEPARSGAAGTVGFIAALGIECGSLRRQRSPAWLVVQSGPGAARASAAAARAVEAGASLLISWGLAGGLDGGLGAGTLVVPRRVIGQGAEALTVDAGWHARLASLAGEFTLDHGDLLTVPSALETPAAKRAAAAPTRAVAVDMESAAVEDSLPRHAEHWIDEHGERRMAAVLRAVASPREWRGLLTLARRYRAASGVLDRLARALASRRLLTPDSAAKGTDLFSA
jgi:adenosylhomocysteine nucleosidase